jgi:hypothetical protein
MLLFAKIRFVKKECSLRRENRANKHWLANEMRLTEKYRENEWTQRNNIKGYGKYLGAIVARTDELCNDCDTSGTGDEETNATESTFEIDDPDSRGIKRDISDARRVLND